MTFSEFKAEVGKDLTSRVYSLGFSGSGLNYCIANKFFTLSILFVEVPPNSIDNGELTITWEAGIHPVGVPPDGQLTSQLTPNNSAIRFMPAVMQEERAPVVITNAEIPKWKLNDYEGSLHRLVDELCVSVESYALKVLHQKYKDSSVFDMFTLSDLADENFTGDKLAEKLNLKNYFVFVGTSVRFAWELARFYESRDTNRAKAFANFVAEKNAADPLQIFTEDINRILAA